MDTEIKTWCVSASTEKIPDTILPENKNCAYLNSCNHLDCCKFCLKRYKTDYYFNSAFIFGDKRLKFPLYIDNDGSDAESFSRLSEIEKDIESFVDSGNNLYIYSQNVGNGKTSWALRLANGYINKSWYKKGMNPIVLFISVPRFLLELKANISTPSPYIEHIQQHVTSCDLVIWDDIGSKNGTEFEVSHLLSIIDQRINNNKSNIYTSNLNNKELHQLLGDRLYSRVYNYSENIKIVGKDKRGMRNEKN